MREAFNLPACVKQLLLLISAILLKSSSVDAGYGLGIVVIVLCRTRALPCSFTIVDTEYNVLWVQFENVIPNQQ